MSVRIVGVRGAIVAFVLGLRAWDGWGGGHWELESMIQEQGLGTEDQGTMGGAKNLLLLAPVVRLANEAGAKTRPRLTVLSSELEA